jgi:hypothetical protein
MKSHLKSNSLLGSALLCAMLVPIKMTSSHLQCHARTARLLLSALLAHDMSFAELHDQAPRGLALFVPSQTSLPHFRVFSQCTLRGAALSIAASGESSRSSRPAALRTKGVATLSARLKRGGQNGEHNGEQEAIAGDSKSRRERGAEMRTNGQEKRYGQMQRYYERRIYDDAQDVDALCSFGIFDVSFGVCV